MCSSDLSAFDGTEIGLRPIGHHTLCVAVAPRIAAPRAVGEDALTWIMFPQVAKEFLRVDFGLYLVMAFSSSYSMAPSIAQIKARRNSSRRRKAHIVEAMD